MYLKLIVKSVAAACDLKSITDYTIVECSDGQQLLIEVKKNDPALITLDINMPIMDGLTALVKLRSQNYKCPIILASSENNALTWRLAAKPRHTADEEKRNKMLNRVIDRVKLDQEEPGKINSVLEACANLRMDFLEVAKVCGATAFIKKPYEVETAGNLLAKFL